jgi:hypothetical protein
MLKEHDRVVLTQDIPGEGLQAGDVGVIVFVPKTADGYILEFVALDGDTIAVVDVTPEQVRPVAAGDIPHARRSVA